MKKKPNPTIGRRCSGGDIAVDQAAEHAGASDPSGIAGSKYMSKCFFFASTRKLVKEVSEKASVAEEISVLPCGQTRCGVAFGSCAGGSEFVDSVTVLVAGSQVQLTRR